ncbi:exonuclease domain-containing protein [Mesoplasma lactucae]|uniref:Exonuclease n=1 Tax=Mesoplasma lactucae ATCC 49193 TaxID=81460 RepID=A0A291IRB1_9MOLU|nr:exonuclease domain-containing protein [Mesoplasma lactucae]ATG97266.1 exonuclease [Mesoplasma lactucae ATCC 49193]ATZ20285.1 DNA polymerase III subunit epsilon [Mesoplasma lactucae ATCC 49193]MCL8216456.1 DNA polymerase III PolC-type [Mesoplasma lactucae ATCC 49193]
MKDNNSNAYLNWERFMFLDFETANYDNASACQLAFEVYEHGKVIFSYNQLIKPSPYYFHPFHVSVHGIKPEDVIDAPEFDEVWEEIKPWFNQDTLVIAHNASFDMGVLSKTLDKYEIEKPQFYYGCSVFMLRKMTDYRYPSYSLGKLANQLDISFNHHDAMADAHAIKQIIDKFDNDLPHFTKSAYEKGYRYKKFN